MSKRLVRPEKHVSQRRPAQGEIQPLDALSALRPSPSSGRPLDEPVRSFMESRFGHDFSRIRVFDDDHAARSAEGAGAQAYTSGSDVVFGPGRYDTEHSDGLELIAHELAHVVQNENAGYAHPDRLLSQESDAAENEAAYAANAVSTGHTVTLSATPIAALSMSAEGHGHAGWMDRLFGLNPDRSFVEAGMEGLGYGPTGIWGRPPAEDEGQGTTLLRALGAAATSPLAAFAAVGGHALDEINHGPLFFHGLFDK